MLNEEMDEVISSFISKTYEREGFISRWLVIAELDSIEGKSLVTAGSTSLTHWDAAGLSACALAQAQDQCLKSGN